MFVPSSVYFGGDIRSVMDTERCKCEGCLLGSKWALTSGNGYTVQSCQVSVSAI